MTEEQKKKIGDAVRQASQNENMLKKRQHKKRKHRNVIQ
jgi:hypothetical protein